MKHTLLRPRSAPVVLVTLACVALSACHAIGPDYERPDAALPAQWAKPETAEPGWQAASPADDQLKGAWWELFGDPTLNALERQALQASPALAVALARLEQAQAQVAVINAATLPRLGLQAGVQRFGTSADRPLASYSVPNSSVVQSDYNVGLSVSYELDFLGRVRRLVEAARAGAEQVQADTENTRLLLTAQLASSYWSLRELDAERAVLASTLDWQGKALRYMQDRHELGAASAVDVAAQEALLAGTRAQWLTLQDQRARYQHAIATLVGSDAISFRVAPWADGTPWPVPPRVALDQPAALLQRRPDIASAERAMAVANAQIGVARAGYFPTFTLGGLLGNDANDAGNLFTSPALLWSLGVSATQTLFDNGQVKAAVESAGAAYRQSAAAYRATVLNAVQEVADALGSQSAQARSEAELRRAVGAAERSLELADARYQAGAASYLEVITAEQTALGYRRQWVQNQGAQQLTAVQLAKALGGGYRATPDPKAAQ